jgi:hypothetical protein
MTAGTTAAGILVVAAAASTLLAGATLWLILTDPVTITHAVSDGRFGPLADALAHVVVNALRGLLRWL